MKYNRILLKISGESLASDSKTAWDSQCLERYAAEVESLVKEGVSVAIVVGGGNIIRGAAGTAHFDRITGDKMGMLATTLNGLALASAFRAKGLDTEVFSACPMEAFAHYYHPAAAKASLDEGNVVIVTGGTGNPFFTTDSASALRAIELETQVFLKGTRVDGVYTADPEKDPSAKKFTSLSFDEALERNLRIMDLTAFTLCRENGMQVVVFDMNVPGNALAICRGEAIGTIIK